MAKSKCTACDWEGTLDEASSCKCCDGEGEHDCGAQCSACNGTGAVCPECGEMVE